MKPGKPRKPLESRGDEGGTLYVVATPIGNLEDVTLRALRVLGQAEVIAAEKVGHTRVLCRQHGIGTPVTGFRRENQNRKTPLLVRRLKEGADIALVTDAGTPGISDPGGHLIDHAAREGIRVVPVPGPSAVSAALSVSGLPTESFLFAGFLPSRRERRRTALRALSGEARTLVFFEAPHRLQAMLADLLEVLGDRHLVMLREMTKMFEDIRRGRISRLKEELGGDALRGEFTLVVAGREVRERESGLDEEVLGRARGLVKAGRKSVRDIAALVAAEAGVSYRSAYQACLAMKRETEGC